MAEDVKTVTAIKCRMFMSRGEQYLEAEFYVVGGGIETQRFAYKEANELYDALPDPARLVNNLVYTHNGTKLKLTVALVKELVNNLMAAKETFGGFSPSRAIDEYFRERLVVESL